MRRRVLRTLVGGMLATWPGLGGLQPPPGNAAAAGALVPGVQPGATPGVILARLVIIAGTGPGLYIYQPGTTPGHGNGPVLSGTEGTADPYGNTGLQPGWTAYLAPGSGTWASIDDASLLVNYAGANSPGTVTATGAGEVLMQSGNASSGDTESGIELQSADANAGVSNISLVAETVSLTGDISLPGWTSLSIGSLSSGRIRVMLLPWTDAVWLDVAVATPSTGTSWSVGPLPSSSYYPSTTLVFPLGSTGAVNSRLTVTSAGAMTVAVGAAGTATLGGDFMYPTN